MRKPVFLITAGPTVEDLDPVRFISNRATGKLGFATAAAAAAQGHRVVLVHGPVDEARVQGLPKSRQLKRVPVRSCAGMHRAVLAALPDVDVVIMTAAVADFTPAKVSATKLKKAQAGLTIRLKPTVDILKALGQLKPSRKKKLTLIGFALETGSGRTPAARLRARFAEARRKLETKNLDAIVLDAPAAMGADAAEFHILRAGTDIVATLHANKTTLAKKLIALGRELHASSSQ